MISYRHFSKTLVSDGKKQAGKVVQRERVSWQTGIIRKKLRNYWNSIFCALNEIREKNRTEMLSILFDAKGNVKGVRDMEIVDYPGGECSVFVVGITPYYYEHGVFMEDHDGVRMKYRIQKLIYRRSGTEWSDQRI